MARPKNQTRRRAEMIAATQRAINERGVAGLRLRDIADEAGLSIGLVHYYFPDMEELVVAVHRATVEQFVLQRQAIVEEPVDPPTQLVNLIRKGLPSSRDDEVFRLFYELHSRAAHNQAHADLMSLLWERDVSLYVAVLTAGVESGDFSLRGEPRIIAQCLVAFEDGLSVQVLSANPAVDIASAMAIMTGYASEVTGCRLGRQPERV